MRTPSRLMPAHGEPKPTLTTRVVTLFLAIGLILGLFLLGVEGLLFACGLVVLGLWSYWKVKWKAQALSHSRKGEGICEFARAANCRVNDPWIVRAVYEELSGAVSVKGSVVPIRWDDQLEEDLGIDPEDLDMGIAPVVGERAGRSLTNIEKNPLYGKVRTAGDLVAFFNAQPFRVET